jgi:hypothetical protein
MHIFYYRLDEMLSDLVAGIDDRSGTEARGDPAVGRLEAVLGGEGVPQVLRPAAGRGGQDRGRQGLLHRVGRELVG